MNKIYTDRMKLLRKFELLSNVAPQLQNSYLYDFILLKTRQPLNHTTLTSMVFDYNAFVLNRTLLEQSVQIKIISPLTNFQIKSFTQQCTAYASTFRQYNKQGLFMTTWPVGWQRPKVSTNVKISGMHIPKFACWLEKGMQANTVRIIETFKFRVRV